MKVIIIGSAKAGEAAFDRICFGETGVQAVLYEKNPFLSCGAFGLPYYLAHRDEDIGVALRAKEQELASRGIDVRLRHEVLSVSPRKKEITVRNLETGETFTDPFDRLILCTGAAGRIPQVPGAGKMGVHMLRSVQDLLFLREFTKTPYVRDIAILGGNEFGLELAKAFYTMGRRVRIIEARPTLLPDFDPEMSTPILQLLKAGGVTCSLGETVQAFRGETFVSTVETTLGAYPCDLAIAALGNTPSTALVRDIGLPLAPGGGILTDALGRTTCDGIYAAGACAVMPQADTEGATSSLHLAGIEIARTGLSEEQARQTGLSVASCMASGCDRPGVCPNPNPMTIKLVYETGTRRILGAQGFGRKNVCARIGQAAVAIRAGMTPEELAGVAFPFDADPVALACAAAR